MTVLKSGVMVSFCFFQFQHQRQRRVMLSPAFAHRQSEVRIEQIEINSGTARLLENQFRRLGGHSHHFDENSVAAICKGEMSAGLGASRGATATRAGKAAIREGRIALA
jgi:hypothetical protein